MAVVWTWTSATRARSLPACLGNPSGWWQDAAAEAARTVEDSSCCCALLQALLQRQLVCLCGPSAAQGPRVFSIFIFFKIVFYRNIFSVSQFKGIYPYRPAGGRQAPPNIKAEVPLPHLHLQQTTSIEGKRRDVG